MIADCEGKKYFNIVCVCVCVLEMNAMHVSSMCFVSSPRRSKRTDSQIHQAPNRQDADKETGNNRSVHQIQSYSLTECFTVCHIIESMQS